MGGRGDRAGFLFAANSSLGAASSGWRSSTRIIYAVGWGTLGLSFTLSSRVDKSESKLYIFEVQSLYKLFESKT